MNIGRLFTSVLDLIRRKPPAKPLPDPIHPVKVASSFTSFSSAERAISSALKAHEEAIRTWVQSGKGSRFSASYEVGRVIGEGIERETGEFIKLTKFRFVLKRGGKQEKGYFLLTAYPVHQTPGNQNPACQVTQTYSHLANLFNCWFDRDVDVYGDSLDEVLINYRIEEDDEEQVRVAADIRRFISQHGSSDEVLVACLEEIFRPDVIVEGWDAMTTRQWFEYVAKCIER